MNQQKAAPNGSELAPQGEFEVVAAAAQTIAVPQKTPKERALIVLRAEERTLELIALAAKSADIVEVLNVDARTQVHRMAMDLKNTRVEITKEAESARQDSTKFSKAVIDVERELIAITTAEEDRLFKLRDDFDEKLAAEKAEADRIERERIHAIRVKIDAILSIPQRMAGASAAELTAELERLAATELTKDDFAELLPDANAALDATAPVLIDLRNKAAEREKAEADRLAAIEAENKRLAAEAEANRLERERLAALQREHDLAEAERQRKAQAAELERQRVAAGAKRQLEQQQAELAEARKDQEAAAARDRNAMAQIEAIQHQVLVAQAGRMPYCHGGDIQSYEYALKGTREWVIDEENFGGLAGIAEMARKTVIGTLESGLAQLIAAQEQAAREAAEATPAPMEAEAVQTAVEAEETAPEPVCAVVVAVADAPAELLGESTVKAFEEFHLMQLREVLLDMLETKTPDEVRAIVEVELAAFAAGGA